ncbi:MAG: TolC family protein, partial [Pseudomonadota bacterium]
NTLSSELSENAFTQNSENYSLGLVGDIQNLGMSYDLSYTAIEQDREEFESIEEINKSGFNATSSLSFQLLEGAGYLVGGLPFEIAEQQKVAVKDQVRLIFSERLLSLLSFFLVTYSFDKKLGVSREILKYSKDLSQKYKNLFEAGKISKISYLTAKIQVQTALTQTLSFQRQFNESLRSTLLFAGEFKLTGLARYTVSESALDFIKNTEIKFRDIEAKLEANPELRFLNQQLKATKLQKNFAKNRLLPNLSLTGSYLDSQNNDTQSFLTGSRDEQDGWSVGLSLEIPLNNDDARGQYQDQLADEKRFELQSGLRRQDLKLRVRKIYQELRYFEEILKNNQKIQAMSKERYDSTIPLLDRSSTSIVDVLIFQNELQSIQFENIDLKVEILLRKAELLILSGNFLLPSLDATFE